MSGDGLQTGRCLSELPVEGDSRAPWEFAALRGWHPIRTNLSCHSQSKRADGVTSPQGWSGLIYQWSIAQATLPMSSKCTHASSTAACNTLSKRHCVVNDTERHRKQEAKANDLGTGIRSYASGRFREAHGMQTAAHDALTRSICHSKPLPSWRRNLASILWLTVERLEQKTVSCGIQCDHSETSNLGTRSTLLTSNGSDRLRLPCQWSQNRDARVL